MKYLQMIRSLSIPRLEVFEILSLQNKSYTKIMCEQERNVFRLQVLLKYEQNLKGISLFNRHFTKRAYFRILQVILDAVSFNKLIII